MPNEELKPCPFCGNRSKVFTGYKFNCTKTFFPKRWMVFCLNCNHKGELKLTRKSAIKSWNRRADDEEKE